jgi:hypothetical protein
LLLTDSEGAGNRLDSLAIRISFTFSCCCCCCCSGGADDADADDADDAGDADAGDALSSFTSLLTVLVSPTSKTPQRRKLNVVGVVTKGTMISCCYSKYCVNPSSERLKVRYY